MNSVKAALACSAILLSGTVCADDSATAQPRHWRGGFVARIEALALLETLNAELLTNSSATLTLEHWCERHQLASPPTMTAVRVSDVDKPVTAEQRIELGVLPAEPVRYRRVQLLCGAVVLSEADNWYVPGRLTPEMNRQLAETNTPFGKVVQALHFQRHTLSSQLLWQPLPEGWEMHAPVKDTAALLMPHSVLEHRAVLSLPDGTPFSEVIESYTADVLSFRFP
jgi:chorismate-pyruvate lyase